MIYYNKCKYISKRACIYIILRFLVILIKSLLLIAYRMFKYIANAANIIVLSNLIKYSFVKDAIL